MAGLNQLKRDVSGRNVYGTMTIRCSRPLKEDTSPSAERCRGERRIAAVTSNAIRFICLDGRPSDLRFDRQGLVEYDGNVLNVYRPGYRVPTSEEQEVLDKWEMFRQSDEYQNSYNPYWSKKRWFAACAFPYLSGIDESHGCKLDTYLYNSGKAECICDKKVRGVLEAQYLIRREPA